MARRRRTAKLRTAWMLVPASLTLLTSGAFSEACATGESSGELKKMSLDELLSVEVTSVSRGPEKLGEAASAVQVISQEDIRRSGATSLPEALRLAPNLQVAQVNSSQWAISARGFNNVLADKLLVMIDGRTVYTPLYAGVFWDAQDVALEDIERIEVISGPGGALWGANAVNGVINITTQNASKTQGLFVEGGGGDELRSFGSLRYGAELTPDLHYRVYAKATDRDDTVLLNGDDAHDGWHSRQGGFRLDWDQPGNSLTVQSDFYSADPNPDGAVPVTASGGNLTSRWRHVLSKDADVQLQFYYDRTRRDFRNGFLETLGTYDLDWQHRFTLDAHQAIVWGLGLRRMDDQVDNLPLFAFLPGHKVLHLYSAFVQDEIRMFDDRWRLTLGSKFEYNDYTGMEYQPSVRLAWTPTAQQTLWTAASRAVRTPARIDRDFFLNLTPTIPLIAGDDFQSETVLAYELGWRWQPQAGMSVSLSTFFNDYDDLRSAEPGPPPLGIPLTFENGVRGQSYGVEWAATYALTEDWKLRGGYTFLKKHLTIKPGSHDLNQATSESDDPENQVVLQSMLTLAHRLQVDAVLRYVDALPNPRVASYMGLDLRLAWTLLGHLELAVVGQNLLDARHPEFVPSSPSPREIERSFYGKVTWRQ